MSAPCNEPAFPVNGVTRFPGMSLRDWFAGQAIAGIEAAGFAYAEAQVAADAYKLADAMLLARATGEARP